MKSIQEKELMETEKPRIEKYLKYNYQNIKTVTLTEVIVNPTGVPHIQGYVNDNKEMSFDAGIYDEHFEGALNVTGDGPLHRTRYAVENGIKNVSDIEEEVQQKKRTD
ncbi:DUF1433 domain-containing protein [Carnobacterium gallinarum]|uniref:DUF1433 domain-containing protein n=1 Tax=Carnobacterium gallinarum TaxID=2749 RepID=UPI000692367F|nr:DUF1433 domain-containing protein [Carnobacterium gallinarum]